MTNESSRPLQGTIGWIDLTIPNAPQIRNFYSAVVGWKSEDVSMGEYSDFNMIPGGGNEPVAGICHARGKNSDLPSSWMIYVNVDQLDSSLEACSQHGGKIIRGATSVGAMGRYAIIEDPSGANMALFESAS